MGIEDGDEFIVEQDIDLTTSGDDSNKNSEDPYL